MFISIVLMLYYAVRGLISVGQDPESSTLLTTDRLADSQADDDATERVQDDGARTGSAAGSTA